jgi:hypothetical protein
MYNLASQSEEARMRACATVLAALLLTACGPEPTCVDEEGEELPVCVFGDDELEYCPGDQWASADGCISFACGDDGVVLETEDQCL